MNHKSLSKKNSLSKTVIRFFCICYSVIIIFPFVWMFYNTFKTNFEYNHNLWALPTTFKLDNYVTAITKAHMGTGLVNSIIIVGIAIVLNVALGAIISYALARFKFFGSDMIYKFFLLGILIPRVLTLIPYFFLMHELHLYDTRLAVILAFVFWGLSFAVFLLVAFFKTLPKSLEEAARLDGCSYFRTFFSVILPIARSGLITVTIFNFLEFWSTYIIPLTLLSSTSKKPVSLGLVEFSSGVGVRLDYGAMFAASIISMIPPLLLFMFFNKKLISGLTAGGVKQ